MNSDFPWSQYEPDDEAKRVIAQEARRHAEENILFDRCFAKDIDPLRKVRLSDRQPLSEKQQQFLEAEILAFRERRK